MTMRVLAGWLLCVVGLGLGGCMSVRTETTLDLSAPPVATGDVRFRVLTADPGFEERARSRYPGLFSDELSALPVRYEASFSGRNRMYLCTLPGILTLAVLPGCDGEEKTWTLNAHLTDPGGDLPLPVPSYQTLEKRWASVFTPLALLFVIGPSEGPSFTAPNMEYAGNRELLTWFADLQVDALARALAQAEPAALRKLRDARARRLQQLDLAGEPLWSFIGFARSDNQKGERPYDLAQAMFFRERPTTASTPLQTVSIARRGADGRWQPVPAYLRFSPRLTRVALLQEEGLPARVALQAVAEPPLEDFIEVEIAGREGAAVLRWSNDRLLEAKNVSLPRLLRSADRAELTGLVTRIEKAALDLSELAERNNDLAQQMVAQGKGEPTAARELALLCRQRIEIFKPILAALRQELLVRER